MIKSNKYIISSGCGTPKIRSCTNRRQRTCPESCKCPKCKNAVYLLPNGRPRQCSDSCREDLIADNVRSIRGLTKGITIGQIITNVMPTILSLDPSGDFDNISYCPHTGLGRAGGNINDVYIACSGVYVISLEVGLVSPPVPPVGVEIRAMVVETGDVVAIANFDPFVFYATGGGFVNIDAPGTTIVLTAQIVPSGGPFVTAISNGTFRVMKVSEEVGLTLGYASMARTQLN
jgi:hypothetical protein